MTLNVQQGTTAMRRPFGSIICNIFTVALTLVMSGIYYISTIIYYWHHGLNLLYQLMQQSKQGRLRNKASCWNTRVVKYKFTKDIQTERRRQK